MKNAVALLVVLSVTFAFASSAQAAPGEPRLVQGVLEWPSQLTVEPFVVVRGEDGQWYYADIKTAKHLESSPLVAGTRVAVLGTEATKSHEITAIALGSGDAAALAMALMPHVNPTAAVGAAPPLPESPSPSKAEATKPPQTPKSVARPAPAVAVAPPAKSQVTEPAIEKPSQVKVAEPSEQTGSPQGVPAESPRWAELQGTVKVITGDWVVVQAADGEVVLVDLSTVHSGAASLKPGSPIAVYGTRGEQKFQAMGRSSGKIDHRPGLSRCRRDADVVALQALASERLRNMPNSKKKDLVRAAAIDGIVLGLPQYFLGASRS